MVDGVSNARTGVGIANSNCLFKFFPLRLLSDCTCVRTYACMHVYVCVRMCMCTCKCACICVYYRVASSRFKCMRLLGDVQ